MVASPKYLARHGTPQAPADLLDHDCIVYANHERSPRVDCCVKRKVTAMPVRARVAVNSFMLARDFAVAGLGIAPACPVGSRPISRLTAPSCACSPSSKPPLSPLHAVFPPGPHLAPRVRAFVDLLASRLDTTMSFPRKRRL